MNTNYIKWYKHSELENMAAQIHQKYTSKIPIDIDYIAESMGVDLFDIARLKEDYGLYGFLAKIKGVYTIYIQKGQFNTDNYYTNFTIAEELSHYILHKKYFRNVNDLNEAYEFYSKINATSEVKMELDAKYLAGAILVPYRSLKREISSLFKKYKKVLFEALGDDFDSVIDKLASELNDYYQVPETAISYRLKGKSFKFKKFLEREHNKYLS